MSITDFKPIDWLPIEQMKIGDSGLLVTNDDHIVPGELIENDLVRVFEIDQKTLSNSDEYELAHITEFKSFYAIYNPDKLH